MTLTVFEICAGAGGQAIGLEMAGFVTTCAVEIDNHACQTLRHNRPEWEIKEDDLRAVSGLNYSGVDLLAGGVPCPPFSIAGKQLGENDERDLFPEALRLVKELKPKAVMLENVRGLASAKFDEYRKKIIRELNAMGYEVCWDVLNASDYGVPQLRPRFLLVALKSEYFEYFQWPQPTVKIVTVSDAIADLMGANAWTGLKEWKKKANHIAPTIVGGSKKHGGADLGPTRAKMQWEKLGVNGKGIADAPPTANDLLSFLPKLTNRMVARIQGFPDYWEFQGGKTSQHRQMGNAFPPPVAKAVGLAIQKALFKEASPIIQRIQPSLFVEYATA